MYSHIDWSIDSYNTIIYVTEMEKEEESVELLYIDIEWMAIQLLIPSINIRAVGCKSIDSFDTTSMNVWKQTINEWNAGTKASVPMSSIQLTEHS